MGAKQLIFKMLGLGVLIIGLYAFALWKLAQGYVDQDYPKFNYQAGSLILGASRAQEGIIPSLIEDRLPEIDKPVLNFAFKLTQSSYGPVYLDAVKRKIKPGTKNGLFILSVSPGSIAIPEFVSDSANKDFDAHSILNLVEDFNSDPNYRYIRKFYAKSLYKGLQKNREMLEVQIVHKNGWLEFPLQKEGFQVTEEHMLAFKRKILYIYSTKVSTYKTSKVRIRYLNKTIDYLQKFGTVVLVRLPADPDIRVFEDVIQDDFEKMMSTIANKHDVLYYSYLDSDGKYRTYDGSHLSSEGAHQFTADLCSELEKIDFSR